MNVAKSLYLGGKIIYANDNQLNSYSYKNLGLHCPVCSEPVHLKNGGYRQPHFAHFKGTDPKQVEECSLKVSVYGNNTQGNWSDLYEGRGQRIEIFQKHFLDIIASNNRSFYSSIKIIQRRNFS